MLLSDGSGLTSRQVAGGLARLGHTVGVLSSDPIALTRWTNAVRHWHRVPPFGADPVDWLDAAIKTCADNAYDLLLPTQEQVAVLSWAQATGRWPKALLTVVPPFGALAKVQDKLSAARTLSDLGLPRPASAVFTTKRQATGWRQFPAFVKSPIGTASRGVARIPDAAALSDLLRSGRFAEQLSAGGVLVEEAMTGPLAMTQAIFDRGVLLAFHANGRVAEGSGGGASQKESMRLPGVRADVARLGASLAWHGALSADVILDRQGRHVFIDINPRIVEPGNAWRSGVDLVRTLIAVGVDDRPSAIPDGRSGVRTHQLLLALLGAAERTGSRRAVWREFIDGIRNRGDYADSHEELTPIARDPRAAVPVVAAVVLSTLRPDLSRALGASSTAAYSITPKGWAQLVRSWRDLQSRG